MAQAAAWPFGEGRQELKLAEVKQVHEDNRLLAALPHDALAEVSRELRQVSLVQGKALFEPGAPLDEIYFPQSGMISLMVVKSTAVPSRFQPLARRRGRSAWRARWRDSRSRARSRKSAADFRPFRRAGSHNSCASTHRCATSSYATPSCFGPRRSRLRPQCRA